MYKRQLLAPGGEIWFKTDDDALFADTMVYFDEGGWRVLYATTDLHAQQLPDNIVKMCISDRCRPRCWCPPP